MSSDSTSQKSRQNKGGKSKQVNTREGGGGEMTWKVHVDKKKERNGKLKKEKCIKNV